MFPDLVLGLSDHTPGLATTLGAVALGARMIEKHLLTISTAMAQIISFQWIPCRGVIWLIELVS